MKINGADKKYMKQFIFIILCISIYMLIGHIIFKVDFTEILLALIISLVVIIIPEFAFYKALHYNYQSCKQRLYIKNILKHRKFHKLEHYPIYYENGSDEYAAEVARLFDNLPDGQKNCFISKGFSILIGRHNTLRKIFLLPKNSQGSFSCIEKSLTISQYTTEKYHELDNDVTKYMIKLVFYHEWCHFLDYYHGYISSGEVVKKLYKEDKNNHTSFKRMPFGDSLRDRINDAILYSKNKRLYKYKNTDEYLAVNYSDYKIGGMYNTELIEIFNILESTT